MRQKGTEIPLEKITFFLAAENISLNCITLSKKLSERTSSLTSVFDFAPKKKLQRKRAKETKTNDMCLCGSFNVATFKNNCFCFLFCFHSSRVHVIKCCVQFNRSKNLCYTTHVRCALYTVQCGMVSCTCAFPWAHSSYFVALSLSLCYFTWRVQDTRCHTTCFEIRYNFQSSLNEKTNGYAFVSFKWKKYRFSFDTKHQHTNLNSSCEFSRAPLCAWPHRSPMYKLRLFFVENNSRNFIISFRARAMVIEEMNGFITVKCFAFCIFFFDAKVRCNGVFPITFRWHFMAKY